MAAPHRTFMPKVPPRRKRQVPEEDHELQQMIHHEVKEEPAQPTDVRGFAARASMASGAVTFGGIPAGGAGGGGGGAAGSGGGGSGGAGGSAAAGASGGSAPGGRGGRAGGKQSQVPHGPVSFSAHGAQPIIGSAGLGGVLAEHAEPSDEWLDDPNAPIVLPFEQLGVHAPPRTHAGMRYPEGSAADVLLSHSAEQRLHVFQLPADLPTSPGGAAPADGAKPERAGVPREFPNRCKELGSGCVGKLRLHRSGRVTLRLGEIWYDLCVGTQCMCAQEVVALSAEQSCSLGGVAARMLCIPNVEQLTAHTAGAAGGGERLTALRGASAGEAALFKPEPS